MADLRRTLNGFKKKSEAVFSILFAEGTDYEQIAVATGNHELFNLPPNSVVTEAFIVVETAGDSTTSVVITMGTAAGGAQIMTGGDGRALGRSGTTVAGVNSGTGATVWLRIVNTGGTATNVGRFRLVV